MKALLKKFAQDENGATAIEYGLIAALVGVAIIAGVRALGGELNETFSDVTSVLETR
ncbi:MAG: Flp family type IVb pilin [Pseudomonadota bacterium]